MKFRFRGKAYKWAMPTWLSCAIALAVVMLVGVDFLPPL